MSGKKDFGSVFSSVISLSVMTTMFCCTSASADNRGAVPCPGAFFAVDAKDDMTTRKLCALASEISGQLMSCGLQQSRPLTIEVVNELSHPLGDCLAYFDCEFDLIRVTDPATYEDVLEGSQVYENLPPEVVLRALVTHEMAHALVTQTAGQREVPMVDQEYIAASMEIEFMEEASRDVLLALAPMDLPPKEGLIDIWIYGFAPRKFAVNAWQHFSLPGNGCSLIRQIVEGEASFSKDVRPELR